MSEGDTETLLSLIPGQRVTLQIAKSMGCWPTGGRGGYKRPLLTYHEAWGTSAAPSDAVAVSAILAGAGQLATIAIVAGRTGLIAEVARPAWLAGTSSSDWVAAEQRKEEIRGHPSQGCNCVPSSPSPGPAFPLQ